MPPLYRDLCLLLLDPEQILLALLQALRLEVREEVAMFQILQFRRKIRLVEMVGLVGLVQVAQ
jgi:hypothetical protein